MKRAIRASTIAKNWGLPSPRLDDDGRALASHPEHLSYAVALSVRAARGHRLQDDAIGAAYLGLCVAARGFDACRGVKFTTYARPHILAAIADARQREECRGLGITVRERRAGVRPNFVSLAPDDSRNPIMVHPWEEIDARMDCESG